MLFGYSSCARLQLQGADLHAGCTTWSAVLCVAVLARLCWWVSRVCGSLDACVCMLCSCTVAHMHI